MPPLIAAPLMATWGAPAIGALMGTMALVSLVCTFLLHETKAATMRTGDHSLSAALR